MDLTKNRLQTEVSTRPLDEHVLRCCRRAKELEECGHYEAARSVLDKWWQRVGEWPQTEGLGPRAAAELLLRVGALTGWIGSANQIEGAQETAKDLISASAAVLEQLGEAEKLAETRVDLGLCYWREGASEEARVAFHDAIARVAGMESEQRTRALVNLVSIERAAMRYHDALRVLNEAAPLVERSSNILLKGRFHNQLAIVLEVLGTSESREDYLDRALVEYTAASCYFEQGGHVRFVAYVENNLGLLFLAIGRFAEAHEHLKRARKIFLRLKDAGSIAQVDETRGRALLALGQNSEAERVLRSAVNTLEKGGERALLAKALTTRATALARLGRREQAHAVFNRAVEVAQSAGDKEGAGQATLSLIEELSEQFDADTLRSLYERADDLLAGTQHTGVLARLRACARKVVAAQQRRMAEGVPAFVHRSETSARMLESARTVARSDGSILITGETGTGKELLARLIHIWSGRKGNFVSLNCAALNDTLCESQVFGHRKGSFTGATEDYGGAARAAADGTLFLDEVSGLSLSTQSKLLRLVEYGEIHPLGAIMPERINLRVIAATSSNLKELVAEGRFRADLFYRLETFNIEIPPLRERKDDIPAIAEHFITESLKRHDKRVTFTKEAIETLRLLPLKGNARELRSLIERTMLVARDEATVTAEMVETVALRPTQNASLINPWAGFSLKHEVHRLEQRFIELALRDAGGRVSHAARLLGFKHHESLSSLLKSRFRNLQDARTPSSPRKRSIINKH